MHKIHEVHHQICLDNNDSINLALLQMRSTPVGARLPNAATLLFNRPIRALLSQINMEPINFNANDKHHEALKTCNDITLWAVILSMTHFLPYRVYSTCLAQRCWPMDTWHSRRDEQQ